MRSEKSKRAWGKPHLFALRADHRVFRYGITVLAVAAAALLVASNKTSSGITIATSPAPDVNLLTSSMTVAASVSTAPIPLITARLR
ncbi:MAG TPA: hypothetical protein VHZ03_51410 [Trebonia sp.]|nr:hypothetical protein [Trebonia sp.]